MLVKMVGSTTSSHSGTSSDYTPELWSPACAQRHRKIFVELVISISYLGIMIILAHGPISSRQRVPTTCMYRVERRGTTVPLVLYYL